MRALNRARALLTFLRKMPGRERALGPARGREGRLILMATIVADLMFLADRYGIRWREVQERAEAYVLVDKTTED